VRFVNNTGVGIAVTERGGVTIHGTAAYPVASGADEGTVIVKGNTGGGIAISQCISDLTKYKNPANPNAPVLTTGTGNCAATLGGLTEAPPTNTIDGAAVWGHTTQQTSGLTVSAGSEVKLRNSVVLGNAYAGVLVENGPAGGPANSYRVFDLSTIDLGKAADAGKNLLQVGWGVGAPLNGGAGIAVAITRGQAQTLPAQGNRLQDNATSGSIVDCSTQAVEVSRNFPNIATCFTTATKGISVCGTLGGVTPNQVDVAMCTVP
jgi:hypothetical protein